MVMAAYEKVGALPGAYPLAVFPGDRVKVNRVTFQWMGPASTIYVCWGLKGSGPFSDGEGLEGRQFASQAISVPDSPGAYVAVDRPGLNLVLIMSSTFRTGLVYDTFVWLSTDGSAVQERMVELTDGAGKAPDTDAGIINLKSPGGKARSLQAAYAKV